MEENNIIELEEWKPVVGYEGLYEVSNMGRVKRLGRKVKASYGSTQYRPEMILKHWVHNDGRYCVTLRKNSKKKNKRINILVAEAFIGERPEGYHVCHISGDYTDNNLSNLRYDTVRENSIDHYRQGSKGPNGKLSIEQVLEIRKLYATGDYTHRELGKKFNTAPTNIGMIINKHTFSWLNDDGSIDESNTAVS